MKMGDMMQTKNEIISVDESEQSNNNNEKTGLNGISRRKFLFGTVAAAGAIAMHGVRNSEASDRVSPDYENKTQQNSKKMPIIDVHRHCMWKASGPLEETMESTMKKKINWCEHPSGAVITVDGISSIVYPELMDIDLQVRKQDEAGVAMGILSFSMELELMCRELSFPSDNMLTEKFNDKTAEMVTKYPSKLAFMAIVNPSKKSSIAECDRCIRQLGAKGVNISTSWQGEFLDSEKINPFWEYAQAQDVTIFLHPPFVPLGYQKMNMYRLEEVVGRPFDTAISVARMIYSGVFDRYSGLKIVLPHMGGGLPNVIGRLDFGYRLGYQGLPKGEAAVCKRKPSDYLRTNFYVDIMGFSPTGIKQCIEIFGIDRVLFGTDYPAVSISPKEHIDIVRNNLGLSVQDQNKILSLNAQTLFHLQDPA